MISKLLIANRGEIACRIIRTAREMGVATVAVYSDADAKALHVRRADEAVHIGPSPANESYLVGEKIIAAAQETGADAIHPGYGFLSENADFAQAVIDAGLIWVGPKPASIRAMGLKDAAKKLMREAGVPVTPGYEGEDQSVERLKSEADAIGYPVLIKAVAGGGGKGMRKVDEAKDFEEMLQSCRREAKASFSNDEVLLEKWITSPRHIEVQVFGDSHGNVVHLFERDCSLQRRHQKVIEEAPAPGMDAATREEICGAAIRAAKAVDYEGAGTIEFIADASEGLRADRIFFMEMNTRLQVEHPVTEEITGVDLVEWQLRVASGEALPLKQDELSINGWAIEARLYAEDPAKGFLPSTGPLDHLILTNELPSAAQLFAAMAEGGFEGNGADWMRGSPLRVETGVEQGAHVSPFYDPMIAKLVAHGPTRDAARQVLTKTCAKVEVWPVKTNAAFLVRLLRTESFASGDVTTDYIGAHLDELTAPHLLNDRWAEAGLMLLAQTSGNGRNTWPIGDSLRGFRLNREQKTTATIFVGGEPRNAPLPDMSFAEFAVDEEFGNRFARDGAGLVIFDEGQGFPLSLAPRVVGAASAGDGAILAPMPGKVIALDVAEGQKVKAGDRLMVLEAMKMEHALTAPFDGTVTELAASEGAQVQVETVLAVVEPAEE